MFQMYFVKTRESCYNPKLNNSNNLDKLKQHNVWQAYHNRKTRNLVTDLKIQITHQWEKPLRGSKTQEITMVKIQITDTRKLTARCKS